MNAVQVMNTGQNFVGCSFSGRGLQGRGLAVLLAAGAAVCAVFGVAERTSAQPGLESGVDFRGPCTQSSIFLLTFVNSPRYPINDGLGIRAVGLVGPNDWIDIGGIAFFTPGAGGQGSAMVQITTVYGIDMAPTAPLLRVTGFTQTGPRIVPVGVETIISHTGTNYTSGPRINVPISGIATLLPGHDLSWFAGANPSSSVFAFQTIAPLSDIYVGPTTPPCIADVSGDGTVDGGDFTAFINSFGAGDVTVDAVADVNGDSVIDGDDFVAFINAFGAGC